LLVDLETETLLLTGAAGWLGQGLVSALTEGLRDDERLREPRRDLRLRVLLRPGETSDVLTRLRDRVTIVVGDVRDPAAVRQLCDGARGAVLFHTAGVIHPRRVRELYEVNVLGTRTLLKAAVAAGVRRVVVVSSNSPCGCNGSRDHRFDESSPYNPYMNYGRSKMLMEESVHAAQEEGRIETVIVRPPWFYGPFQPPRQSLFFRMIKDGKAPIVGDGNNPRSMAYIDNLAQGLILAAAVPGANGRTYWIADERPYTMNEIVDTVENLLETEFGIACARKRLRLPSFASDVAWLADKTLQSLGVYHQKIHVLSEMNRTIACTIERAKAELGYRPMVALEEGMRRSLQWMLSDGSDGMLQRGERANGKVAPHSSHASRTK
jgi:nucleoside-diphosphate-sugar epimerase